MSAAYRLGVDTGGTFTDFILADPRGQISLYKTPSTPSDPPKAIHDGLRLIAADLDLDVTGFLSRCEMIIHGTTVALNALIEHKGASVALLCTAGHEDSLEIRLGHKEDGYRYDAGYPQAEILVPRYLRLGIDERVLADGSVRTPLDQESVYRAIDAIRRADVEAVAISLIWSFLAPEHERRVEQIVREELPDVFVSTSLDIFPQIREYTRTSTTVTNAYLGPILSRYVKRVEGFFKEIGYDRKILYVQSNGGLASGEVLSRKPVYALNSGPAAGPAAGLFFGDRLGHRNVITVDMGGTSFDISLSWDGRTPTQKDFDFMRYRIGIPMLQVETLGAGGGSIAKVNSMGLLQVGPESAGAEPGPACYQRGGTDPTVTDSLVVLGYLSQDSLLGGRLPIDASASAKAVEEKVAIPLGIPVETAALGIFKVVNAAMVAGIRRVSIEKGYDPRDFALVSGGGAGSAHAARLAEDLGVTQVIVPRVASGFCAFGEIISDVKHNYLSSYATRLDHVEIHLLNAKFSEMEERGRADLMDEGVASEDLYVTRSMDMRYVDQVHECAVDIPATEITEISLAEIAEAFHKRHEELFTYAERDNLVEIINLESTVYGRVPKPELPQLEEDFDAEVETAWVSTRDAYFEEFGEYRPVPVYAGERLTPGMLIQGPAILEEVTTTVVVFPEWELTLDPTGVYVMSYVGDVEEMLRAVGETALAM